MLVLMTHAVASVAQDCQFHCGLCSSTDKSGGANTDFNTNRGSKFLASVVFPEMAAQGDVMEVGPAETSKTLQNRSMSCKCQATRQQLEEDIAVDVMLMANSIKNKQEIKSLGEWQLVEKQERRGRMGFWRRESDKMCAVSFSGTDPKDLNDWIHDIKIGKKTSKCGARLHLGFFQEAESFRKQRVWKKKIQPMLQGADCCCVILAGHSLGGAVADVMTQCSLHGDLPFEVNALHTYGAPKASKGQIKRPGNKCIWGLRFVAYSKKQHDIVTRLPPLPGWSHPKIKTVEIDVDANVKTVTACDKELSIPFWSGIFRPNVNLHLFRNYKTFIRQGYTR